MDVLGRFPEMESIRPIESGIQESTGAQPGEEMRVLFSNTHNTISGKHGMHKGDHGGRLVRCRSVAASQEHFRLATIMMVICRGTGDLLPSPRQKKWYD